MSNVKLITIAIMLSLLFVGCTNNNTPSNTQVVPEQNNHKTVENEPDENENNTNEDNQPSAISMLDFFLPDGSKAHYLADGNEFAELRVEVAHPYEQYVIIHENNGGTLLRRIYKIGTDKIDLLEEKQVDVKQTFPSNKELDEMIPIGVYLQQPFTEGATFDDWTIVKTGVSVDTPYQKFDDAIVIEMIGKDYINRKYFVQGFGEVKRESIMETTDGDEYIVTSTLESVTK